MQYKKHKYLSYIVYPLSGLLALVFASSLFSNGAKENSVYKLQKGVNLYLENAYKESSKHAAALKKIKTISTEMLFEKFQKGDYGELHNNGINVCFYTGKGVSFWSSAAVIENNPGMPGLSGKINGGWYVKFHFQRPEGVLVYYVLIKQEYPIDNKYLGDTYPKALSEFAYGVYSEPTPGAIKIKHPGFSKAFFLHPKDTPVSGPWLASF